MAQESVLVDDVRDVAGGRQPAKGKRAGAAGDRIRVSFATGVDARLDPGSPRDRVWAEVLQSLRDTRQPAYVEIDPDTRHITSLLLPVNFTVAAVRELPGADGVEVELEISHARHYLRREHPRFEEMLKALESARRDRTRVLVTESLDGSSIIDVRPAPAANRRRRN
ncbi:MAG: hypothetical protein QOH32_3103 [Bradyrhizobium sp.]|jgi:hypothetical protein|nr:hypothetical protein [Bradyrhizobium sp.]